MKASQWQGYVAEEEPFAGLADQFRELSPWLRQRLRRRVADAADLDDLVQESFLRLSRYDPRSRERHPRALLLRIATNLVTDGARRSQARGHGRHVPIDGTLAEPALVTAPDQEAIATMKRAILRLPEPFRIVFALARFTPMSQVDIAESLGISVKTVEWRLARAITMCLEEFRH